MNFLDRELVKKCGEVALLAKANIDGETDAIINKEWMEVTEFLGNDVVYVKDKQKKISNSKHARIFFGFNGTNSKAFNNRFDIHLKQVISKIDQIHTLNADNLELECYEIVFCGYSLGGAEAAVLTIKLRSLRLMLRNKKTELLLESIMEIEIEDKVDLNINLNEKQKNVVINLPYDMLCVTIGAPLFGNKVNQKHCSKRNFSNLIYNVIDIDDRVLKFADKVDETAAIGHFKIYANSSHNITFESIKSENIEIYLKTFTNTKCYHSMKSYLQSMSKEIDDVDNEALNVIADTNKTMQKKNWPYLIIGKLGRGTYGYVMEGTDTYDYTTRVAVKKINIDCSGKERGDNMIIESNREISVLLKIEHDNIVKMKTYLFTDKVAFLIFELCISDLRKFIKNGTYDEKQELPSILGDCLLGLKFLHEMGIIHRDIKPVNILVSQSQSKKRKWIYKIGDLGSISIDGKRTIKRTACGTYLYASPEMNSAFINGRHDAYLNPQTDIFSMGAAMIFCGKKEDPWTRFPFVNKVDQEKEICKKYVTDMVNETFPHPYNFKHMLVEMLSVDYKSRPTAIELLENSFN